MKLRLLIVTSKNQIKIKVTAKLQIQISFNSGDNKFNFLNKFSNDES